MNHCMACDSSIQTRIMTGGILYRGWEGTRGQSRHSRRKRDKGDEGRGTHQLLISMYCGHTYDGLYEYLPSYTEMEPTARLAGVATFSPPAIMASASAMAQTSIPTVHFQWSWILRTKPDA